jgi:hypothetical protein
MKAKLTEERKLRRTNKSGNEIYIVTWQDAPNTLREIGRLREIAFRAAGGGSGKSMDLDEFDTCDNPYKQLIVWDPEEEEILGGYRYILGRDWEVTPNGRPNLATSHMFRFSEKFMREYAPYTIELGRSFVTLEYQSSRMGTKGLFALDNLWDGLGALTVLLPEAKYMYGKVTVYPHYNATARDLIFGFINKYFPDNENLITPIEPFKIAYSPAQIDAIFTAETYKENYKILNKEVRSLGVNIPPLVNAYMGLSPCMRSFGFAVYHDFGNLIECAIMIPVDQIYEEKYARHVGSHLASQEPPVI